MTVAVTSGVVSAKVVAGTEPACVELIDVRTAGEFRAVHAVGARNVPLDRLDAKAVVAGRKAGATIYLICKSGKRAGMAAERFVAAGVANVVVVEGGTDAWVAAGLPVERGRGVISLERQVRIAAGFLVVVGVVLGVMVNVWFVGLSAFVGAGLMFAGATDTCGMGMVLARMPWNKGTACKA